MKRVLGTHRLEPDGYLAMAGQKYPLTDIGLENLLLKLIEKGERDRQQGPCSVKLEGGAKVGGRECSILEVTHAEKKPHYDFHKAQIFMDNEWKIPVRYAAFNWPTSQDSEPEVIEEYTYQNVKINVGLTDKDFDFANADYNFHK
jgi:outer membrane lipoprotein-sorting protein